MSVSLTLSVHFFHPFLPCLSLPLCFFLCFALRRQQSNKQVIYPCFSFLFFSSSTSILLPTFRATRRPAAAPFECSSQPSSATRCHAIHWSFSSLPPRGYQMDMYYAVQRWCTVRYVTTRVQVLTHTRGSFPWSVLACRSIRIGAEPLDWSGSPNRCG